MPRNGFGIFPGKDPAGKTGHLGRISWILESTENLGVILVSRFYEREQRPRLVMDGIGVNGLRELLN